MWKLVVCVSAVAVASSITTANAADLRRPLYKAPPPVVYEPWTGGYVGANVGYSWGKWDSTSLAGFFPITFPLATTVSPNVKGWLGDLQAGYNWRFDANWVGGSAGDLQVQGERASLNGAAQTGRIPEFGNDFNDIFTLAGSSNWKLPWFATLRGRLGLLLGPNTLFYATGGLAIGEFKFDSALSVTCQQFGPGSTGTIPTGAPCTPAAGTPTIGAVAFSERSTRLGGAIGAGIKHKFSLNWSAKLEYLYLDFGTRTFFSGAGFATDVRLRDNIVRVGINYAFDQPVVARY